MQWLIVGLALFFAVHSISIVNRTWRNRMVAQLGEGAWKGLYSVLAAVGFVCAVYGYGLAREAASILYVPPPWLRHLALLLMLPVFPFLLAANLPGRIKATIKHPMLNATKFWASAHLCANGGCLRNDLIAVVGGLALYGVFVVWAHGMLIGVPILPGGG